MGLVSSSLQGNMLSVIILIALWLWQDYRRRKAEAMAKTYDYDSYLAEAQPVPFVLRAPDGEIIIEAPDGDTLFRFEEAGTSRQKLRVLCGKQWTQVFELFRNKHHTAILKLAEDMIDHFNLGAPPEGGGRPSST